MRASKNIVSLFIIAKFMRAGIRHAKNNLFIISQKSFSFNLLHL